MTTETERTERRAARRANRQERRQSPLFRIPFRNIRNPLKPMEILSAEAIEKIHLASMRIVEEVGVVMMDVETLDLWEKAGAKVDHTAQLVKLDRGLLLELVSRAPAEFTWRARNPAHDVAIGGNALAFLPQGGVVYVSDLDYGRRRGTLKDYENFLKINQMVGVVHFAGEQLIAPHEVPSNIRHLKRLPLALTLTDKALLEAAHGRVITADALYIARLVFGESMDGPNPVLGGVINASSPLRYDDRMLGGLLTYARAGQVNVITPFILAGAMSPITIASALAQQNAEALIGIALTQLVRPGAPVVYGGFTTNVDMKTGSPAMGTPEGAWAMIAGAQLARRYNLPYRGSGTLNTSKVPDAESMYETLWTTWPAVMAHTNLIMHSVGWLEGGLTVSYEKIMMDVENLAMFQHFLAGMVIDDETLALEMIKEVGPGGHHFGTPHTQARFATEFYESILADRLGYETWAAAGEWDAPKRANALWKDVLANYEQPPLDIAIQDAVSDYVARRERELEGKSLYD